MYRDQAVSSHAYTLDDLVELDERLEAHLDGLALAGTGAWDICKEEFGWEDAGEIFTGAVTGIKHGREAQIGELLACAATSPELARGLISALGWVGWRLAAPYLRKLLGDTDPASRCIGIAGAAIHRTQLGSLLEEVLQDESPLVRARALRAVGEMGRVDLLNLCHRELESEDEACRFWAAWSTALLGNGSSLGVLRTIAESAGRHAERAADIAVRRMSPPDAAQWLYKLAENPDQQRLAVRLAGVIGDPALVPWLLQAMKTPELARLAGDTFSVITGVDLAAGNLAGNPSEGFRSGPTDDAEDENVAVDPDEDLPWPDTIKVTEFWLAHQGNYAQGMRCIRGKPITTESLLASLHSAAQNVRASAAMEAALLKSDHLLFNVRAPGRSQQAALGGGG